jgi:hypothetical protein
MIDVEFNPPDAPDKELTDQNWLASIPIRAQLTDPTIFDGEALRWRHDQPAVKWLQRQHPPTAYDMNKLRVNDFVRKRYGYMSDRFLSVNPPERWNLCPACGGTGKNRSETTNCDLCWGGGHEVTYAWESGSGAGGPDDQAEHDGPFPISGDA